MTGHSFALGPMERVLHLRMLPALEPLPAKLLGAVAQNARERFFTAGEHLLEPDREPDAAYVVVDGQVTVERLGRKPVQMYEGDAVGFLELLARIEGGVTARAVTNTLTIELGENEQLEVCEQYFPVLHAYVRFLARQLVSRMKRSHNPFGAVRQRPEQHLAPNRPLDLVERVLTLSGAESFSARSMDAIVELARHVEEVRYDANHTLWHRGDDAPEFVLITDGTVSCSRSREHEWDAGPSLALGMHEVLAGRSRWYSAEALTDVRGLRIHTEPLLDMMEDHFELALDMMAHMASRVIELSDVCGQ